MISNFLKHPVYTAMLCVHVLFLHFYVDLSTLSSLFHLIQQLFSDLCFILLINRLVFVISQLTPPSSPVCPVVSLSIHPPTHLLFLVPSQKCCLH